MTSLRRKNAVSPAASHPTKWNPHRSSARENAERDAVTAKSVSSGSVASASVSKKAPDASSDASRPTSPATPYDVQHIMALDSGTASPARDASPTASGFFSASQPHSGSQLIHIPGASNDGDPQPTHESPLRLSYDDRVAIETTPRSPPPSVWTTSAHASPTAPQCDLPHHKGSAPPRGP